MSKSTKVIAALGVAAGLGVAALPAATFAETTVDVPLKVTVDDVLSLEGKTTGGFASTTGKKLLAGETDNASKTEFTVKSNATKGWQVTVAGTEDDTTNKKGATLTSGTVADDIAPFASQVETLSGDETSGWGIKLSELGDGVKAGSFATDKYTGVTKGAQVVANADTKPTTGTDGQVFTATYGIQLSKTQAAGTYEGSITYTVAAKE